MWAIFQEHKPLWNGSRSAGCQWDLARVTHGFCLLISNVQSRWDPCLLWQMQRLNSGTPDGPVWDKCPGELGLDREASVGRTASDLSGSNVGAAPWSAVDGEAGRAVRSSNQQPATRRLLAIDGRTPVSTTAKMAPTARGTQPGLAGSELPQGAAHWQRPGSHFHIKTTLPV